ncbi:MAG: aldehyde dehydrogenase family protein, partial [Alphaproteobacteria bacterium]|nr:aldehyde dehydrogenase family protein [Alphaproteobacteria bacterium]
MRTAKDTKDVGHYIGGAHLLEADAPRQAIYDPATGESERSVVLGGAREVDLAVEAARSAWRGWAAMPSLRRARVLDEFRRLMNERRE